MAAKIIQISNDDGTTFDDLPGSTGSFNTNGEEIDDTILGQTYQSAETGLIDWGVESDGIFKGFAGYVAELKKGGTPTVATAEAMSQDSGQIYSIDEATKEIWDRSVAVVIKDGVTTVTDEVEFIDYLFGIITFVSTYTVVGAITVDVTYLPTVVIGKGNTYTLTMTAAPIDNSDFATVQDNDGFKTMRPGLRTVTFEQQGIFDATESAKTDLSNRSEVIVEIDPAGNGQAIARGFFRVITTAQGGAVGALEDETIGFSLNVPFDAQIETVFNWRFTSTTLAESIQSAITSFLTELNTYDVRYLPSGAIGESPMDGIEGNVMFGDISLTGGLDNMNVFTISMIGTGAYTVV